MKFDPIFKQENHSLVKIDSGEIYPCSKIQILDVLWSQIEPTTEEYDEDFLAKLRLELKEYEQEAEKYLVIRPVAADKASLLQDAAIREQYVAAVKHCVRRLKDCTAIIGLFVPKEFSDEEEINYFMEEIYPKHKHYVFFA